MTQREIAENVLILVDKGVTHDIGDTDYFYDVSDEIEDEAYEMMDELRMHGEIAFREKYLKEN